MDYFLNEYKKRCKKKFGEYGFVPYRNYHNRIINDVFQCFCLHRSRYGTDATVEFCVLPLSQEYKIDKSTCSAMHLKKFENSSEWFPYISGDQSSINDCIEQLISYMEKYLMPFFQNSTNCANAYETLKIFDATYNEYTKMIMALKNEQYLYAKQHIINIIMQSEYAFERNKEILGQKITKEYIDKMEKKISEKRGLLKLIEDEDYNTIQEWLMSNEKRNKHNLGIED